jgi:NAD-dependent dihydropyrimidine dehydrogenase PreA subunit
MVSEVLRHLDSTDEEQQKVLLREMRARNYVPESMEDEYLEALWQEFRKIRAEKLGQVEETFHGIPREKIKWHPTVDDEKCTGCGKCVKFCQKRVYTLDDKARVTNPYRCVVSCTGCLTQCAEGAISFPSLLELREDLKQLRKKYGIITA